MFFQTSRSRSRGRSRKGSPRVKNESRYSRPTYNFRYKSRSRSRKTTNDTPNSIKTENLKKSYGFDICPRISESGSSSRSKKKEKSQYIEQAKSYHESIKSNTEQVRSAHLTPTPLLNQSYQSSNLLSVRDRPSYNFDNEYDVEVSSSTINSSKKIAFGLIEENKELLRINDGLKDEINILRRMNIDLESQNRSLKEIVESVNGDSVKEYQRQTPDIKIRKFNVERTEGGIKVVQGEDKKTFIPRKESAKLVESELVEVVKDNGGESENDLLDKNEQTSSTGNKDTQPSVGNGVETELKSKISEYEKIKLELEEKVMELEETQVEKEKTIQRLIKENTSLEETYEKRIKGLWDEIEEKNDLIISLNERIEDSKSGKTLQERVQGKTQPT